MEGREGGKYKKDWKKYEGKFESYNVCEEVLAALLLEEYNKIWKTTLKDEKLIIKLSRKVTIIDFFSDFIEISYL